jgi:hypothetical protein
MQPSKTGRRPLRDEESQRSWQAMHTEDKVVGFCDLGDRVWFCGTRGAFWGLRSLFPGGLFMTTSEDARTSNGA